MTNYRKILEMHSQGHSQRSIEASVHCSHQTVRSVLDRAQELHIPDNIVMVFIPPYTPEMNPIEQIWDEIREKGFRNECFPTLAKVMERLCDTINNLSKKRISSITGREWILSIGV